MQNFQKLDTIDYRFDVSSCLDGAWPPGSFSLTLNGVEIDVQLKPCDFLKSAVDDGYYDMFICDCGGGGHEVGGVHVLANEAEGTVSWLLTDAYKKPLPPPEDLGDFQKSMLTSGGRKITDDFRLTFSATQYRALAEKMALFMSDVEQILFLKSKDDGNEWEHDAAAKENWEMAKDIRRRMKIGE